MKTEPVMIYLQLLTQNQKTATAHALPFGQNQALCGIKPSVKSLGWKAKALSGATCPRCLEKLKGEKE